MRKCRLSDKGRCCVASGEHLAMTYKQALIFGLFAGIAAYIATAAGRYATATSAIPYALGTAVVGALFMCALVAYKNGQPKKR